MADALRPRGVFILDMSFAVETTSNTDFPSEEWAMRRKNIEVIAAKDKIVVKDNARAKSMILDWGGSYRRYTSGKLIDLVKQSRVFTVEAWHPEVRRTEEGISVFDIDYQQDPPLIGRAMVILKRLDRLDRRIRSLRYGYQLDTACQ